MFIMMTNAGIKEQMIAAMPLGTCISPHATRPLPKVIIKNPPIACRHKCSFEGSGAFATKNMKPNNNSPALVCLIAVNRNGGKLRTAIRKARYVVPQMIHTAASAK